MGIASSTLDGEPDDLPGASTSNTGVIAGGILGASAFVCLVLVVARKMFMVRRQKDITVQKDITSAKGHYWSELKPKRAVTAPEQKVKEWRWALKIVRSYECAPSMCQAHVP